ncbi:MAG: helix-turn-helix transcriptional regulator [Bacteroidales bacterium]|jgi:transcriptional regulator with XRE-family HTH domain|nr:helix-turn-helix transcriptional regulator [Bacteroidales bacterium]
MRERILAFLKENQLSATRFADTIGVQRSSISHLLSGRNKPSFDFIEKTLLAYPELNAQWLITGKGEMYTHQKTIFDQEHLPTKSAEKLSPRESNIQTESGDKDEVKKPEEDNKYNEKIERIVLFYRSGKFQEYKP